MATRSFAEAAQPNALSKPTTTEPNFFDDLASIFSEAAEEIGKEFSQLGNEIAESLSDKASPAALASPAKSNTEQTAQQNAKEDDQDNDAVDPSFFDDLETIFRQVAAQDKSDQDSQLSAKEEDVNDPDFFDDLKTIFNQVKATQEKEEAYLDSTGSDQKMSDSADDDEKVEPNFFDDLNVIFRKILAQDEAEENAQDLLQFTSDGLTYGLNSLPEGIPFAQDLLSEIENELQDKLKAQSKALRSKRKVVPPNEIFAIHNSVTEVNYTIKASYIPKTGDLVEIKEPTSQQVTLVSELSKGGEGIVYNTNLEGQVAKIYQADKINSTNFEKLKLMCSKHIQCEGICFPTSLLYNQHNEFVGFLMPKAQGKELVSTVLAPNKLRNHFGSWNKADLVQLCISILEKINFLHDRNVLLGDINPRNILVESPTKVYFVDTDSYQVEGFPCQVATTDFNGPELQNQSKHFSQFLRSFGNENFTLAILLFEILMLGKHPYSIKGGDTPVANIRNAEFAYDPHDHTQGKIPDGPWLYLWSHLSVDMKKNFYNTFNKTGANHLEHLRMSSYDWLESCQAYLNMLQNGKLEQQDPMSLEVLPTRCKQF